MQSLILKRRLARIQKRQADKAQGLPPAVTRFSSMRALSALPNVLALPVRKGERQMQHADGSFLTMPGYDD